MLPFFYSPQSVSQDWAIEEARCMVLAKIGSTAYLPVALQGFSTLRWWIPSTTAQGAEPASFAAGQLPVHWRWCQNVVACDYRSTVLVTFVFPLSRYNPTRALQLTLAGTEGGSAVFQDAFRQCLPPSHPSSTFALAHHYHEYAQLVEAALRTRKPQAPYLLHHIPLQWPLLHPDFVNQAVQTIIWVNNAEDPGQARRDGQRHSGQKRNQADRASPLTAPNTNDIKAHRTVVWEQAEMAGPNRRLFTDAYKVFDYSETQFGSEWTIHHERKLHQLYGELCGGAEQVIALPAECFASRASIQALPSGRVPGELIDLRIATLLMSEEYAAKGAVYVWFTDALYEFGDIRRLEELDQRFREDSLRGRDWVFPYLDQDAGVYLVVHWKLSEGLVSSYFVGDHIAVDNIRADFLEILSDAFRNVIFTWSLDIAEPTSFFWVSCFDSPLVEVDPSVRVALLTETLGLERDRGYLYEFLASKHSAPLWKWMMLEILGGKRCTAENVMVAV